MELKSGEHIFLKSDKDRLFIVVEIDGDRIKCIDNSGRTVYLSINDIEKFKS